LQEKRKSLQECRVNGEAIQKGETVDRKGFMRTLCGAGVCGCALNLVRPPETLLAEENTETDQRLAFVRYELAKMVGFMAADTAPAACAGILEKTGRECAKLGPLAAQYKGNPEGYFSAIKANWGTDSSWNKEKGIITVAVAEGECGCPLVDSRRMPAVWCNCSRGYQKEAFETIFGKKVDVSLKESKLSGSKRCVFEIKIV
jgi:predicted hydrocarbon binding protein